MPSDPERRSLSSRNTPEDWTSGTGPKPQISAEMDRLLRQLGDGSDDRFLSTLIDVERSVDTGLPFRADSLVADRFRIVRMIGRGGFGVVYEAYDQASDNSVALKVLHPGIARAPELSQIFRGEVQVARKVAHPAVCRVYDIGRAVGDAGQPVDYMVMELLQGETLGSRIARGGAIPTREAFEIASQLLGGLSALHQSGIVHRDLKPSNIMLVDSGSVSRVVLTDFGIALHTRANDAPMLTAGTPAYMSPEQLSGNPLGPPTDIYSFGLVMYEALTGRRPFPESSTMTSIHARLRSAPRSPASLVPGLPERWGTVLLRCLDPDPEKRYHRAEDVCRELSNGLSGAPTNISNLLARVKGSVRQAFGPTNKGNSPPGSDAPSGYDAVVERAAAVIGDRDEALRWMGTPVLALGHQTPVSLLGTPEGRQRVLDALFQLEHGVW